MGMMYGMHPYLSMAHVNPFMTQSEEFFGYNPMYSKFLAMNYMINPTMMGISHPVEGHISGLGHDYQNKFLI